MNLSELHALLTTELGLVPDLSERGNGRTYFWEHVVWSPAATTRIARVHYDDRQTVTQVRLCVSSDNNNSVLLPPPFDTACLCAAIAAEIELLKKRQAQRHESSIRTNTMPIHTRQATIDDLDQVTPLFDAYRRFYGQPADIALARSFLAERFRQQQSIIFLAIDDAGAAVGFVQLYPSFSSVSAQRIYILNDLFVAPGARRQGAAACLLRQAAQFGRAAGAVRLSLSTALDNAAAQKLYESMGWKRDNTFCHYDLSLR